MSKSKQCVACVAVAMPQYMSPEQDRGEAVDARSDLFSLGSVLYAMCTWRTPFRAETAYGTLRKSTDSEPRPIREINPHIPAWLCRMVEKLMKNRSPIASSPPLKCGNCSKGAWFDFRTLCS